MIAGVAPFERALTPRATEADLWSSIESLTVAGERLEAVSAAHGSRLTDSDLMRLGAFVSQAREYYRTIASLAPTAKPLTAYYFALNLTKAFLTLAAPETTRSHRGRHGLGDKYDPKQRYYFSQEEFAVQRDGYFRELASRTGMRFCWPDRTRIRVADLLPYLVDAVDPYSDHLGRAPKLLPIDSAFVLTDTQEAWLRVEVDRAVLRQRNVNPASLPDRARIFGALFGLVQDSTRPTASYEQMEPVPYARNRSRALRALAEVYDSALIATQRSSMGGRRFILLSDRRQLLSHEAVTFAGLHHLSNMVRYRPASVERLRGSKYFWIFSNWVDRAAENFLLAMASRMTFEDHVIA